jgi:hypothetical protein
MHWQLAKGDQRDIAYRATQRSGAIALARASILTSYMAAQKHQNLYQKKKKAQRKYRENKPDPGIKKRSY